MTTPRLGAPELVSAQATPETTVNEQIRYLESGVGHFVLEDRDLSTPPGSPSDGQSYLVAGTGTGTWTGHDGDIAYYLNTAWIFINVIEGFTFWVKDENKFLVATSASTFQEFQTTTSTVSEASAAEVRTGTETTKYVSPDKMFDAAATVALSESGGNVAVDMNSGFNFTLAMTGNWTLSNPTNEKVGQSGFIRIAQDGTGSRTLAYGSEWKFAGGTDPTLTTTASAVDVLFYQVLASGEIYANLVKAIA